MFLQLFLFISSVIVQLFGLTVQFTEQRSESIQLLLKSCRLLFAINHVSELLETAEGLHQI